MYKLLLTPEGEEEELAEHTHRHLTEQVAAAKQFRKASGSQGRLIDVNCLKRRSFPHQLPAEFTPRPQN